jgi:hypothetical protein
MRRLSRPGRWSVGGVDRLALLVTESGAECWVLRVNVAQPAVQVRQSFLRKATPCWSLASGWLSPDPERDA